jgi:hypothetical protein
VSAVAAAERSTRASIGICVAIFAIALVAWFVDDRTLAGANVWSKPLKFAVSLALHMSTLVWFSRFVDERSSSRQVLAVALVAAAFSAAIEILYIALQAARGRASHFNTETAIESFMYYAVMGGGALIIVGSTIAIGAVLLRAPRPDARPGLRLGAGWGAVIGGVVTLVVVVPLSSGAIDTPGHWVGSPKTDLCGLPLVGWSTVTGDLRVPHFFATHLVQALPVAGWLADRTIGNARTVVFASAAAGLAIVGATFVQAIRGQPFIPQDVAVALGLARAFGSP